MWTALDTNIAMRTHLVHRSHRTETIGLEEQTSDTFDVLILPSILIFL